MVAFLQVRSWQLLHLTISPPQITPETGKSWCFVCRCFSFSNGLFFRFQAFLGVYPNHSVASLPRNFIELATRVMTGLPVHPAIIQPMDIDYVACKCSWIQSTNQILFQHTPISHTPGDPPFANYERNPSWKPFGKSCSGCVPVRCVETTFELKSWEFLFEQQCLFIKFLCVCLRGSYEVYKWFLIYIYI